MSKGKIIIIVAPSGGGKSTLIKKLREEFPKLQGIVTYTTRGIRKNEVNGEDYHFVSQEKFEELKEGNFFIEWAQVHGNYYGSSKESINSKIDNGESILLEIDVQGAKAYQEEYKDNAKIIFLSPPSMDVLEKRLRGRGTETEEVIKIRLETAKSEMEYRESFDYLIINDDIEEAYKNLRGAILEVIN